ncbi:hypothetical protein [Clostridium cuniculi]|uniref:hypothetical protein n=1 Tax=Clostridium cuniculi TaxID=2548455 RepID=UPI001054190E|nr:hypothetical protein [Clostridium cuniculi]
MDKEILEKDVIKAVGYYFNGLSAKEAINKALEEIGVKINNMELTCLYRDKYDGVIKEIKFDSYDFFGKWVADNATEIELIDVTQEED